MTTIQGDAEAVGVHRARRRVGRSFRDECLAELIKLRAQRHVVWVTLAAGLCGIVFSYMACTSDVAHWNRFPQQRSFIDPVAGMFSGLTLSQILISTVGAIMATMEYSSGMIRQSLVACPRRGVFLSAKLAAVTSYGFIAGAVLTVTSSAFGYVALGHGNTGLSVRLASVGLHMLAVSLYIAAVAALGASLGFLLRSGPGAIIALFALEFLLPQVLRQTTGAGEALSRIMPGTALRAFGSTVPWSGSPSTTEAVLVTVLWPLAVCAVSLMVLYRRDA